MNPKPKVWVCTNRHCESPLCCCTNYVDPSHKKEAKAEEEAISPREWKHIEKYVESVGLETNVVAIPDAEEEEEREAERVVYAFDIP